jgi:hypothetical protein
MPRTAKQILESRFANTPHKKIVIYHSPTDCNQIFYEKVNPTHRAIIWGVRKQSENKGQTQIKLGEMYFGVTVAASFYTMANIYTMLITNAFPDISILQGTVCLLVYGLAGAIVIFPKGIGRFVLCGVHGLIQRLQSAPSSEQ